MSRVLAAFKSFFATFEANSSSSANDSASTTTFWVGLSAGVDSTVLLHALSQWAVRSQCQEQIKIKALHVHHGLSDNADAWAQQAQNFCAQLQQKLHLDIECIVERIQLNETHDGIEQAARKARYNVFEKYCQDRDVLLQGHHLDDQFETFFMRALRGSGLTGLTGIPAQRSLSRVNQCQILRPLLTLEKADILAYAKQHQLVWVEDESNQDSQFDRNWWRNELLPQIWQRYPNQKQALSRTINNVSHEQSFLQQLITERLEDFAGRSQTEIHPALNNIPRFNLLLIKNLDQANAVSYLRAWLAQLVDTLPSVQQMQVIYNDVVLASIESAPSFSWGEGLLCRYKSALYFISSYRISNIDKGDAKSVNNVPSWQGESIDWQNGELVCEHVKLGVLLKPGTYTIRNWQAGDTAKPVGRLTRKMKKWWQDYHVPVWAREKWPLIVNQDDHIVAVPGLFVCQGYSVVEQQEGWLVDFKWSCL
jgi:tRNA(Ile)-lysidine synthase